MDVKNPNKDHRNTPEYAEYQRDNFWASNDGNVPPFNTGIESEHDAAVDLALTQMPTRSRQTRRASETKAL